MAIALRTWGTAPGENRGRAMADSHRSRITENVLTVLAMAINPPILRDFETPAPRNRGLRESKAAA